MHSNDAGVFCSGTTCFQGDIRLQGVVNNTGRIEICHNNVWGTVCRDLFDSFDAQVACRQLGLPYEGRHVAVLTLSA